MKPATIARILAGVQKFGGPALQPFLVVLRQHMGARSLDAPAPAIAAAGQHLALCEPFIVPHRHFNEGFVDPIDRPLWTITAAAGHKFGLAQPFLVQVNHGDNPKGPKRGNGCQARTVEAPLPTVTSGGQGPAVVQPLILQQQSGGAPRSTDDPVPTVATDGAQALVEPLFVPYYGERDGQAPRTHSMNEPMPTQPASPKFGLVEPFIFANRTHNAPKSIDEPVPALYTGDHVAVV